MNARSSAPRAFAAVLAVAVAVAAPPTLPAPAPPPPRPSVATDLGDPLTAAGQARREAQVHGRRRTASPLVLPPPVVPLRFTHARHLALGLTCLSCHAAAATSLRSRDTLLPPESTCLRCHDATRPEASPPSACATCHPGFSPTWPPGADRARTRDALVHPPAVRHAEPSLTFNHKLHHDLGVGCASCHGELTATDFATHAATMPLMASCLACHDGRRAPNRCDTCHAANPDGRLRTDLPGGRLRPSGAVFRDAHDDGWLRGHAAVATVGDPSCAACHATSDCLDCHSGVTRPIAVHPNGFTLAHGLAARRDSPHCASCHQSQAFCLDCHQLTAAAPSTAPARTSEARAFHPEGWADAAGARRGAGGGANLHALEARRNVRTCASCHSEASCMACHAPATLGVSPHPPGFGGAACERVRDKNPRVCAKCHAPDARALGCR